MIFTREAFKELRFAYGMALAGIAVAGFLVAGSYWYWQAEKKNDFQSQRSLQDLRTRLDKVKRERDDLRNSDATYKMLTARGTFIAEKRLDLVEALNALKNRHKLISLEYELAPQRVLRMATGESFAAVDVLGSRLKIRFHALHDGDLLAFLDEFPRMQRGYFPLEKCTIKRLVDTGRTILPLTAADAVEAGTIATIAASPPPALEAECVVDWVTLMDKSKPHPAKTDLSFASRS